MNDPIGDNMVDSVTEIAVRYVTISELLYINDLATNKGRMIGGTQEIRDMALLEAAQARPQASAFGQDAYPTLEEKAAVLLHSIALNHPFADGNKRTATVAAIFMLMINGARPVWDAEEALQAILDMAARRMQVAQFVAWLKVEPCDPSPIPDAEVDVPLIAAIFADHRWLLDELAKQ